MQNIIYVKDYVILPCSDAQPGILRALEDAARQGADVVQFEAGTYPLKSFISYETDLTAHDAGSAMLPAKDIHILLNGLKNITICGKTDENGNPATELAGYNHLQLHTLLPTVLWMDNCENITLENLKFRRNPEFASAGKITKIEQDTLYLEVFEGNPCYDNMGTHCINRFTPTGDLNGESLSFGPGLGVNFRLVGQRMLSLQSADLASRVEVGDILTFHQGAKTDFQCFYGNSKNVTLKNLHTANANGFAHLAFNIYNLTTIRVQFKPENNQYFVAPRDAFKLHKCGGTIHMDGMYVEGVRMDGQNMHSNYIFPLEQVDAYTLRVFTAYSYIPFAENTEIEFYLNNTQINVKLKKAVHECVSEYNGNPGQIFTLTFQDKIPFPYSKDLLLLASCWEPDLYICENATFKNIAGAGHLSRIDHMRIKNCKYQNLMNSGILMGTEFPTHMEGGHCTDVLIEQCEFDNCGNTARYDAKGCIGIKSCGLPGKNNKNITIKDCTFKNSQIGIDIHDAADVFVENCTFTQIDTQIQTDFSTSDKIFVDSKPIV